MKDNLDSAVTFRLLLSKKTSIRLILYIGALIPY